jgi:hypothetical protein
MTIRAGVWLAILVPTLALWVALFAFAMWLVGCATVTPLEAYRTDSLACVSSAKTKAEADACRAAVEARYCGDGGALVAGGACGDAQ